MIQSKRLGIFLTLFRLTAILLIGLGISCFAVFSQAQNEGRWYNVEILIFKRLNTQKPAQERWKNDLPLSYPNFYRYLRPAKSTTNRHLRLLSNNAYVLTRYRNALGKSEDFQVLKHMAWSQQIQNERRSPAIIINAGQQVGTQQELEGYIKIHIARFLHITTNLWLTQELNNNNHTDTPWRSLPTRPSRTNTGQSQVKNKVTTSAKSKSSTFSEIGIETELNVEPNIAYNIMTLQSKRRMRSNELHYIDHPHMGIMVFMTPLNK